MLRHVILCLLCALAPDCSDADSLRCGRRLVTVGESTNALLRKCGDPVRKYSSKVTVNEQGRQAQVAASNWVYARRGKRDMIVSVRGGAIVGIAVD